MNNELMRDTFTRDSNNVVIGDNLFHVYCQLHWNKKYDHDKKLYTDTL